MNIMDSLRRSRSGFTGRVFTGGRCDTEHPVNTDRLPPEPTDEFCLPPGFDPARHTLFVGRAGTGKTHGLAAAVRRHPLREVYAIDTVKCSAARLDPTYQSSSRGGALQLLNASTQVMEARITRSESAVMASQPLLTVVEELPHLLDSSIEIEHARLAAKIGALLAAGTGPQCLVYATTQRLDTFPSEWRAHFQIVWTRHPEPPVLVPFTQLGLLGMLDS
jgi:hypothetical protein